MYALINSIATHESYRIKTWLKSIFKKSKAFFFKKKEKKKNKLGLK